MEEDGWKESRRRDKMRGKQEERRWRNTDKGKERNVKMGKFRKLGDKLRSQETRLRKM